MTSAEIKTLKSFVHSHHTIIDAAEEIGISRHVLDAVLVKGSGSPETIFKIRNIL